ncbi:asparagine--tRNA ligase, partial [Flavobacteriaceae bacterium]|nr:asparagine--tRNA ligase [Flavobacteriaceae bacterium]
FEFLREQAHLRIRTSTFSSVMRIRSKLAFGIHDFFNKKDFNYINTPIITSNDAEGAGEMFKVTTLSEDQIDKKETDYSKDFFGKRTSLTVSGQLEAETYALGLGNVYTFGPTFRAENSNTSRHASEFWMIEPEMAFYDLNDNMDLAESFLKNILQYILDNCSEDLNFLDERLTKEESQKPKIERSDLTLIEKIKFTIDNKFVRISYTEAFEILRNSNYNKKKKFKYLLDEWGCDFQSEHERFLVEKHFKSPVIIYDYPTKIKAFYMRLNDDEKTVRAMDVLFPGIGEIIGGSQREERLDVLKNRMNEMDIDEKELWWYLDLRRYGTVPHSGFGLGFERIVMFCTGMQNIRDVIPYPRTPKNASF